MKRGAADTYANASEHLHDELAWLDGVIACEIGRWRAAAPQPATRLRGVYVSEAEIDVLLASRANADAPGDLPALTALAAAADASRQAIDARKARAIRRGVNLPLVRLAGLFGLSPMDERLLLVSLACELDVKYSRLFGYLQDDATSKRPTMGLLARLLCRTQSDRLELQACFSPERPLTRARVVELANETTPLLDRAVAVDPRIVSHLCGFTIADDDVAAAIDRLTTRHDLAALRWPEHQKTRLQRLARRALDGRPDAPRIVFHFRGPRGTGRKTLAAALCDELRMPLVGLSMATVMRHASGERFLHRLCREAILQGAALYIDGFDPACGDDDRSRDWQHALARAAALFSGLTFVATETSWQTAGLFGDAVFCEVELPAPDVGGRPALWSALAEQALPHGSPVDWDAVSATFRMTPGRMGDALIAARNHALARDADRPAVCTADVLQGCRAQMTHRLQKVARKLEPRHDWHTLTLPPRSLDHLREISGRLKYRRTVGSDWGFEAHRLGRKGLTVLFHGPSGTGKTMAAQILSGDLGLDAFSIDLSLIVSKYIGETEKNLAEVFREAEAGDVILFFDEADALFGRRSEVKDAHDRYANIEIDYLLQRVEQFDGLVVLASNLRRNIDDAFFRRVDFDVEFPVPDETARYRIWRSHLPPTAPVAPDVDLDFLARRLELTGGHIANIALNAAYLAAASSGTIDMNNLVRAAARELAKIGQACTEAELGHFYRTAVG